MEYAWKGVQMEMSFVGRGRTRLLFFSMHIRRLQAEVDMI